MLIVPIALVSAAEKAKIKVPSDLETYDKNEFVHWHMLCATQLNRRMSPGEHFDNAVALAAIPEDQLKEMTNNQLQAAGVGCGIP